MLLGPKLALVAILVVAFPALSMVAARRMRDADDVGDPLVRIGGYTRSIIELSLATAAAFALYRPAQLFTFPGPAWLDAGGTWTTLLAVLLVAGGYIVLLRRSPRPATKPRALEVMAWVLPSTSGERRLWLALSAVAAVSEEFLFRGFVVHVLADMPLALPLGVAAVLATLAFALNHLYQGVSGAITAFVIGGAMMLLFAATGNLLVPIVLHALIDARIVMLVRRYW